MTGRAYRDASEPDEGSMTNPSEALIDGLSPIERLAEHLCARRPCGDTPENVADWLDYSLNRCGIVVIEEQRLAQQAATPAAPTLFERMSKAQSLAPVQDDDAELVDELARSKPPTGQAATFYQRLRELVAAQKYREALDLMRTPLTPDRVTPLVEALREARDELALTQGAHGHIVAKLDTALRDGGFDA